MSSYAVHPIRAARSRKGLTQAELGSLVGVTKASVSAWERDRDTPDSRRLAALERALKPHLNIRAYLKRLEEVSKCA